MLSGTAPDPCLLGILLTISTHSGPQLVYHYPSKPKHQISNVDHFFDDEVCEDEMESEESSSSEDEDEDDKKISGKALLGLLGSSDTKSPIREKHASFAEVPEEVDETIFGFEREFLCELLTPPRQLCNTRFELTVDELAFLGLPIHINDDGSWRKTHKLTKSRSKRSSSIGSNRRSESNMTGDENENADEDGDDEENELDDGMDTSANIEDMQMNMFHVVFVMNPALNVYNERIDDMFHFVVSRLSLMLRYAQSKNNYVLNQCKTVLKSDNPLRDSSLARSIALCYKSISNSKIANLHIDDKFISLQIPIQKEYTSLPLKTQSIAKRAYLTTLTEAAEDELLFYSLLLLEEPSKIVADLQAEEDSMLAKFILNIDSTQPLSKMGGMDMSQIRSFASHLLSWKRARIILPLNTKSTYIVSPLAPVQEVYNDAEKFKTIFPSLPTLTGFLSLLSKSSAQHYYMIIPSRDHKEIYLKALEWLIRYGYVTQQLTFMWLKITKRIKISVDEDLEHEGKKKKSTKQVPTAISTDNKTTTDDSQTLPDIALMSVADVEVIEEDTIVIDPERASAVEKRWMYKCIEGYPPEIQALFHKMVKYFNGQVPVEVMMIKEGVTKQDFKKLLHVLENYTVSVKHW